MQNWHRIVVKGDRAGDRDRACAGGKEAGADTHGNVFS